MFWRSFYIKSRKPALYLEERTLYITSKYGNNVTYLSATLLTQRENKMVMMHIAPNTLLSAFNWLLWSKSTLIMKWTLDWNLSAIWERLLSLVADFYSKRTQNYPNHYQNTDNEDVPTTKHCLLNTLTERIRSVFIY